MAIFPWEQRQIVIILCNAHIVRVYLHLVNYEFTVAINTYITHRDRCKYGVAEGPCTENEIFLLVIYNLFETISLYGPQFTHLCGSQNKPLHRQSWVWIPGMCSGGCVTSGKLPNSASLSFSLRPMGNNAFLMGCYAWHTGTLLQMRERMTWQLHLSLEWKRRALGSFLLCHWSLQSDTHTDVDHQQQGPLFTGHAPATKGPHVCSSLKQQPALKMCFTLIMKLPLSSNGTFKHWQC